MEGEGEDEGEGAVLVWAEVGEERFRLSHNTSEREKQRRDDLGKRKAVDMLDRIESDITPLV